MRYRSLVLLPLPANHASRHRQSLSRWHKQLSTSTSAAHGEKFYRQSRPPAAAEEPSDDRRGEETIFFYGGLVNRSNRDTFASSLDASPLGLLSPSPTPELSLLSPVDDETATAWMNTTTMLEACSPTPPLPHSSVELDHAPWWSSAPATTDALFPEAEIELERDGDGDCVGREMAVGQRGRKVRTDVGRSSATIGERSLGEARKTAADVCRNEFDTIRRFSGTETSVTVHDVCNKTISSSSSSSRNGGCSSSQFSSGARSQVASGSCNGSGTVAAASPSDAAVATLGQQQQQHLSISPKKPCDFSSIISDSSSSNSNRGVGGGGSGFHSSSNNNNNNNNNNSSSSGVGVVGMSGSRPFAAPILPATVVGTGDHKMVTALTSLLPDIDWTNDSCIGDGGGIGGHSFTNTTIVDDPRHLWLSSPTASNSSSSSSSSSRHSITEIELERSLDEYRRASRAGQTKTIETTIDCANLLNELQVELTEPPFTNSPPVSLHEEIEQLSSAFDCDVSNHLVATTADALPFVGLSAHDTEPIPLNILKWLQEDIANSNPARPELAETPASFFEPSGSSTHEISNTSATAAAHATDTFERSLDLIHNINGLTRGKRTGAAATATTTTTANTPSSANHPQRDHNYYAMKRRLQEEEDTSGGYSMGGKAKMPKLQHTASDDGWTMVSDNQAKMSTPTTFGHTAATASSSSKQATASTMGRKLSLASRKAPTLAVNVTPKISLLPSSSSSVGGGHAVLLHSTATTGTTTTTSTTHNASAHEPPLRLLPLQQAATLNTPDLTNDILDLEDEKFDLLSFIDTNDESLEFSSYQSTVVVDEKPTLDLLASPSVTSTDRLKGPPADQDDPRSATQRTSKATSDGGDSKGDAAKQIYQLLTLDSLRQLTNASEDSTSSPRTATTTGRRTNASSSVCSIGSRSSASSVCGDSSSDVSSSTTKAPKRRGRPPKAAGTVRDRSQYQHLSEADWRYREQRDKNNEASRKSRINRKDRELKLEMEADRLSAQHQKLAYEERRLQQDCQRWRKAVMKLALL